MLNAKSPSLTSETASGSPSTNSIRSSNKRINLAKQKETRQQAEDTARTERQSVQKLQPAEFKVSGSKTNVKGISSVQSGKVTVKLENGDLALADDMEFENKTLDQLYDKARNFDTNAAKAFTAVYEANISVNDYFLGFTRIHGAARSGKTFEQAVQINEYTAALPSHIQKAAYNAGTQAGVIADDASMKNATSVRAKTEQLRFNEWLKEHKAEVIAKKKEIGERLRVAEANGDIPEMNKQRKEYQALDQWSKETIRDRKAQIGKAVGGVVKYGGGKEVQAHKTGIGADATDIGANATDIGTIATDIGANAVEYGGEKGDTRYKSIGANDTIDGIEIINGKVAGKIPIHEFIALRQFSIKNPDADSMTLGKFTKDSDSYIARAGTDSTYFDMGDEWGAVQKKYQLTDDEMFKYFNRPALDDAISSGKTIRFSHDPRSQDKGFLVDEWEYIKEALSLTDSNLTKIGDFWYVQ